MKFRFMFLLLIIIQSHLYSDSPFLRTVYIQPMGKTIPQADVNFVKQSLKIIYGFDVKVLPYEKLPVEAYYKERHRYRAEKILTYLEKKAPTDAFRILGLTAQDISTTKGKIYDWGIIGLATLDGKACIISTFRCIRRSRSKLHGRYRLGKVAVHEIGHTLGLEHCPGYGCLMEDAMGTSITIDREYLLCEKCISQLEARGFELPDNPKPPWPRP